MELGGCGSLVMESDLLAAAPQLLVAVTDIVPLLKFDGTVIVTEVPEFVTSVQPLGMTQLYDTAPVTAAIE